MTPPGPSAADLSRRLRVWSVSSWRHGSRLQITGAALARLAALASDRDGLPRPPIPDVGVHALADQLQVLADDALRVGVRPAEVDDLLAGLARDLGLSTT